MKTFLYHAGMRVQVRRARFPLEPSLAGRTGRIVHLDNQRVGLYAVLLDGEQETRGFMEEELKVSEKGVAPPGKSR